MAEANHPDADQTGRTDPASTAPSEADTTEQWKVRYEAAARAGRLILYDWDLTNNRLTWGGEVERILGYKLEEMGDVAWAFDQIHPDDRAAAEAAVARITRTGIPGTVEYRVRRRDGRYIVVEDTSEFLPSERTGSRRLIGFLRDITEQRRAEEQLRSLNATLERRIAERTAEAEARASQVAQLASELTRAEHRERQRLAQMLHDHLQQLLVAAKMKIGMLQQDAQDECVSRSTDELRELLAECIEASRSLAADLNPPVLHERGLVAALDWLSRWTEEKHGLPVQLDADDRAEPADENVRNILFQIVRELVFNVVKHAQADRARVHVARPESGAIEICVADDGQGFDPDRSGPQHRAGNGFGLASIQQRLEMIGGELAVESAPGRGCCITIRSPTRAWRNPPPPSRGPAAAESPTPRLAAESAESSSPASSETVRVLIADDHAVFRQTLASLLRQQPGIEVVDEVPDSRTAFELAGRLRPDVVMMEVGLPETDSIQAVTRMKQELPGVRIIALSGHEVDPWAASLREAGAAACLPKGGSWEELLDAIRTPP